MSPTLPLPTPISRLERLIELAQAQGRQTMVAWLLDVRAYIELLEAERALAQAQRRRAGYARAEALTPERRREIAVQAGKRRQGTTPEDSLTFWE